MNTALNTPFIESSTDSANEGLGKYLGTSMQPGAVLDVRYYVWPFWHHGGKLECKLVDDLFIEVAVDVEVKPLPPITLAGSVRLVPFSDRCIVTIGGTTDRNARYVSEGQSILIESQEFGDYKPSIRFWREGAETKADIWVSLRGFRVKVHVAITPAGTALNEGLQQALDSLSDS